MTYVQGWIDNQVNVATIPKAPDYDVYEQYFSYLIAHYICMLNNIQLYKSLQTVKFFFDH